MAWSLAFLADLVGGEARGNGSKEVDHVAPLDIAGPHALAFLVNQSYRRFLTSTAAAVVVMHPREATSYSGDCLLVKDPYLAYARIAALIHAPEPVSPGIHPSAVIAASARIGAGVSISPQCVIEGHVDIGAQVQIGAGSVIEADCVIGDFTHLGPRVVLGRGTRLGRRCVIHAGAVLGADGFGFARDQGQWVKIPQLGRVHVGDDVEIGANATIDRGALRDTVIEDGVKIDNLVQIGHNAHIGAHSALAGCVGVSGSSRLGKRVMLGGGVGISGHLSIADDVTITGMSLVTKSIAKPGVYSSGWPVREANVWRRMVARVHRLLKTAGAGSITQAKDESLDSEP